MKYLVDTDWVIDHLGGRQEVTNKLQELAPQGLALSIVSLAELYEGVYYSSDPVKAERVLKEFLTPDLTVLGINEEICQSFGKERGRLRKEGKTIGDLDLFIASTCLCHELTLLTNNREHFQRIKNLTIISV